MPTRQHTNTNGTQVIIFSLSLLLLGILLSALVVLAIDEPRLVVETALDLLCFALPMFAVPVVASLVWRGL